MEGENGEQVGGELESVTSSAGCFCKAGGTRYEQVVGRGRAECDLSLKSGYRLYHVIDV